MNINLGDEVRMLAVDSPDLVVNKNLVKCVQNINFSLTEEMGFRKAFNNIIYFREERGLYIILVFKVLKTPS